MSSSISWRTKTRNAVAATLLCGSLAIATSVHAATVRQIGTNDLVSGSQIIVHGQVIEKWSEAGATQGSIVTKVVVRITELIKGDHADSTIVLTILGGTLGNLRQHVDGSNIPAIGEEGVYFLEDPKRFLINPMYGWTQGHFVVAPDGQVRTYTGEVVYGFRPSDGPKRLEFAHRHASGVETKASTKQQQALNISEFKIELRSMMEDSK